MTFVFEWSLDERGKLRTEAASGDEWRPKLCPALQQSRAGDVASESQMIEFARHRPKTELDVAQAFAEGQLRKTHAQKLIVTRKAACFVITVVARDAFLKLVDGPVFHDLREDQFAVVHPPLSAPAPAASAD